MSLFLCKAYKVVMGSLRNLIKKSLKSDLGGVDSQNTRQTRIRWLNHIALTFFFVVI